MKLLKIHFLLIFAGLLFAAPVFADTSTRGCETNTMKSGEFCNWAEGKSWCAGNTLTCAVESTTPCPANPANGTYAFSCNSNSCVLSCNSGYTKCSTTCIINGSMPNCTTYDTCTDTCTTCNPGYTWNGSSCAAATLKLGSTSVSGATGVVQAATNPQLFISGTTIGLGISNPTANLHLVSNTNTEGLRIISSNYSPFIIRNTANTEDLFRIDQDGNITSKGSLTGSNSFWNINGGQLYASSTAWNVGIGITNPTEKLTVVGAINSNSAVNGVSLCIAGDCKTSWGDAGWSFDGNTVGQVKSFGTLDNYAIPFLSNGVERMRLTESGNFVLGATSTGVRLHVESPQGAVAFFKSKLNGGSYAGYIGNGQTFTGEEFGLYYALNDQRMATYNLTNSLLLYGGHLSSDPALVINAAGDVGVGLTNPGAKLEVLGTFRVNGALNSVVLDRLSGTGNRIVMADSAGSLYATSSAAATGLPEGASGQTLRHDGTKWLANSILYNNGTNVGIGTTNPTSQLDILSNKAISGGLSLRVLVNSATNQGYFGVDGTGAGGAADKIYFGGRGDSADGFVGSRVNLHFDTNYQRRLTILQNGNVGIGTTNPTQKLVVSGAVVATGGLMSAATGYTSPYNLFGLSGDYPATDYGITYVEGAPDEIRIQGGGVTNHRFGMDVGNAYLAINSGSVGIGTTAPNNNLEVRGASGLRISDPANIYRGILIFGNLNNGWNSGIRAYDSGDAEMRIWHANASGQIVLATGYNGETTTAMPTDGLFIDQNKVGIGYASPAAATGKLVVNGNVGIGTTTPAAKLSVSGGNVLINDAVINSSNPKAAVTWEYLNSALTTSYWALNGSSLYASSTSWNIGIGTTSPSQKLHVSGGNMLIDSGNMLYLRDTTTYINEGSGLNLVAGSGRSINLSGGTGVDMTIASTGNVGIGTTTPGAKLEVSGNIRTTIDNALPNLVMDSSGSGDNWTSQGAYISLGESGALGSAALHLTYIGNGTSYIGSGAVTAGVPAQSYLRFAYDSKNIYTDSNLQNAATGNSYFMGNLGIGTTSPATKLSVSGGNILINDAAITSGTPKAAITKEYLDSALAVTQSAYWNLSGSNLYASSTSWNVGIGTTSPTAKLHVIGNAVISTTLTMGGDINMGNNNITNLNKLTVNTIDPLYNIKGINYSTFAASIVGGVKEEYVGRIKLARLVDGGEYEAVVDFDQVKEGSDLWVWRHTVDFSADNVQVLITPYGGFAEVYYEITGNSLVLRADRPADVSYRLIGKRIDWRQWPTKAKDQKEKAGFVID